MLASRARRRLQNTATSNSTSPRPGVCSAGGAVGLGNGFNGGLLAEPSLTASAAATSAGCCG
jgi:hypothetical protein